MLADLLLQTLRSLRAHKLRFALTSLGIFWGAAMLVFLSAYAIGVEQGFRTQLEKTGPKIVWMIPGAIVKERVGVRGARPLELEAEDVRHVRALHGVERTTVDDSYWNRVVRADGRTKLLTATGLDADALAMRSFDVAAGRPLVDSDVGEARRVAFLGASAAERLFGRRSPLGRTIHVDGYAVRVVGVAERKGDQLINMGERDDNLVMLPHTTARRAFPERTQIERFLLAPVERERSTEAIAHTRALLSARHGFPPDTELGLISIDVREFTQILDALFLGLDVFLVGVALVTLLVGAVGVMNIMLVVVGERVREIGLRKAVGASDRAVFTLFLAEAVAVAALSGLLGTVVGYGGVLLLDAVTPPDVATRPIVDARVVVTVLVALSGVGVVAGAAPALRAARVPPAESLRSLG